MEKPITCLLEEETLTDTLSEVAALKEKLANLTKETNQFTYIITHDLQAPLRAVTGFLELLERRYADKLDDGARQFIAFALKESGRMKTLLFSLLEYSRLNTTDHKYEENDLNEIMFDVLKEHAAEIKTRNAVIQTGDLPVIKSCGKLIFQLFSHLLQNALKFCYKEQPEIHISAVDRNGRWEFCIRDNGIGIDPVFFEKIFVIFKRLHADETKYTGNGTGLAVCKKIVEMHGGTIWVESAPGKGSSFYFTIKKF